LYKNNIYDKIKLLHVLYEVIGSMKRKIFFCSVLIIFAAQFNINLYNSDFMIAVAVILFSLFAFILGRYPILPITFIVAPGVFLSRALFYFVQTGTMQGSVISYGPEIVFYLVYGICICLYFNKIDFKLTKSYMLVPIVAIDYLANLSELLLRNGINTFTLQLQIILLIVAILRTILIGGFWVGLEYQNFSLLKHEHAQRYKKLLILISRLKSEVIWMDKNSTLIENTMSTSYKLYEQLKDRDDLTALSEEALSVAKDIHEVKKEYNLIIRGISEALNSSLKDEGMNISKIIQMLQEIIDLDAKGSNKEIYWEIKIDYDFYTNKQYYLLSIFRNLFNNALEATEDSVLNIKFTSKNQENDIILYITDNGSGISDEYMEYIFNPGFSTKINYYTGEVKRGLGLSLVRDLVEKELSGKISVTSDSTGTTFKIILPKKTLEV